MNNPNKVNILVVDDEPQMRTLMRNMLASEGYAVSEAADAAALRQMLASQRFDLITLDLRLDGDDGLDLAREIRAVHDAAIIMITAKGDETDRIVGLECGADDYIVKPFNLREVLARIRAVLRRPGPRSLGASPPAAIGTVYRFGNWTLDVARRQLQRSGGDGNAPALTAAEFDLLQVFLERPERVLSRASLLDLLNGTNADAMDRSIDTLVTRIRKKIEDDQAEPAFIKTVRGSGYIFAMPVTRS